MSRHNLSATRFNNLLLNLREQSGRNLVIVVASLLDAALETAPRSSLRHGATAVAVPAAAARRLLTRFAYQGAKISTAATITSATPVGHQ